MDNNLITCLPAPEVCVLNFALLNTRSVCHKTCTVFDIVNEHQLDLFAITETWLSQNGDEVLLRELTPPNFDFIHVPRASRGGGVGLVYKKSLCFSTVHTVNYNSFESLEVFSAPANLRVVVIYRPPPSAKNKLTVNQFLDEFTDYTQLLNTTPGMLLMVGDFNFQMDNSECLDVKRFSSLLYSENLCQHVSVPTHKHGHILDLVITHSWEQIIKNISIHDPLVSDHMLITGNITCGKFAAVEGSSICFRRTRNIDLAKFQADIKNSPIFKTDQTNSLSTFVSAYNSLRSILDEHAPIIRKVVKPDKNEPWFGPDIVQSKKLRRKF